MRYLLPLLLVLLIGCASQHDVTYQASGDGQIKIVYETADGIQVIDTVNNFEITVTPPNSGASVGVSLNGAVAGTVNCAIFIDGVVVAQDTNTGEFPLAECKQ